MKKGNREFSQISLPQLVNCMGGGALAVMDLVVGSRRHLNNVPKTITLSSPYELFFPEKPLYISKSRNDAKSTAIPYEEIGKRVFTATALGSVLGFASGLASGKGLVGSCLYAGSTAKISAKVVGVFCSSRFFFSQLRKKDDAINSALAGCCASIFLPRALGGPSVILMRCLERGAMSAFVSAMYSDRPFLPRLLALKNGANVASALPPFTLPLSDDFEVEFHAFYESLKKNVRRSSRFSDTQEKSIDNVGKSSPVGS